MALGRTGAVGATSMDCTHWAHQHSRRRSCGHRSCPRCQHASAQDGLERQRAKRWPVPDFMATVTLPAALRALAYREPERV
ncbi:MAG: hypothetical protein GKR94_33785 [Gammaproteobacteria bacterium]|nr:hypothetical protein [Gammaproteobacteria bacterium]NKC12477.1 hypothetical protein [Gammaproteobacteria bacterium]NKC15575.1 hypothetical protein [Gammaproteobacteria bacterium]NKC15889.1 hypothetical protein [Gammaproteobacteria bacterium]NKC16992.1 hypothetical protein [Gammaproteobacteria bacterium]